MDFKKELEKNKQILIRKETNKFKKKFMKEVRKNTKKGIGYTSVRIRCEKYRFDIEMGNLAIEELSKEYKEIEFKISKICDYYLDAVIE